jgi:hypothetical protein
MLQAFAEDLAARLKGAPSTDPQDSQDARPAPEWPEADDPEDDETSTVSADRS